MTMMKTSRNGKFELRGNRERIIARAQAPQVPASPQGPLLLRPSFAISAHGGGLTVDVSGRPARDSKSRV